MTINRLMDIAEKEYERVFGDVLTDEEKEKIDRAARHEEIRFLKRQQWAVTTAGVVLFGAFLAIIRNHDMSGWCAVLLIVVAVGAGCFFLDDLQDGLAGVRRALDPNNPNPRERGEDILRLHKAILVSSAAGVLWVVLALE